MRIGPIEQASDVAGKGLVYDLGNPYFIVIFYTTDFFICMVCKVCVLFCSQNIYKNPPQNSHLDCEGRSSLAEAECTVVNPSRSCQGTLSRTNETSQPSVREKRMRYRGENGLIQTQKKERKKNTVAFSFTNVKSKSYGVYFPPILLSSPQSPEMQPPKSIKVGGRFSGFAGEK